MSKENPEQKRIVYEQLLEGRVDAIFVLSGGQVYKEGKDKIGRKRLRWKSTAYSDVDHLGFMGGGKARVIAAAELSNFYPKAKIVTNSIVKKEGQPTYRDAETYARELRHRGVPKNRIILQKSSNGTAKELAEMVKMAVKSGWKEVVVLTNKYHIPRVRLMVDKLDALFDPSLDTNLVPAINRLKEEGIRIKFVSAEDILIHRSSHYKAVIDEAYRIPEVPTGKNINFSGNPGYANRVVAELRGIGDILSGIYKIRA